MTSWFVREMDGSVIGPLTMEQYTAHIAGTGAWSAAERNRVAATDLGDVRVSTVFLNLDHSHGGPVPILYETMIFGGEYDSWQWRYATETEARSAHDRIVAALRNGGDPDAAVRS